MCCIGRPQYGALVLVHGGAGLRSGEACELHRRDCTHDPTTGGMWLSVRGTLATPGTSPGGHVDRALEAESTDSFTQRVEAYCQRVAPLFEELDKES
jgi:hypothetical protein